MKKIMTAVMAALTCIAMVNVAYADNNTEFGIEDDLWVGGTGGNWGDADVEIKGFSIFGSTAGITQRIPTSGYPGSVFVGGYLQVSSGSYFMGNSTFPTAGNIFIPDGQSGKALFYDSATGALKWDTPSNYVSGDSLGTHIATKTLDMNSWDIKNVSTVTFKTDVYISSASVDQYGGIYVSTNLYVNGKIYGDGSGLTGIGDNLGNHIATTTLNMSNKDIANANYITASSMSVSGAITASSFTATNALGISAARYQLANNIVVSSASVAHYGGVDVSTHLYVNGKIYGDGSALTGISGDNLGNHIATTTLNMSGKDIANANYITASSMSVIGQITVGSSITVTTNAGIGGNASVTGDLTVNGNATIGDFTGNGTVTLNGANSVAGNKTIIMNTDNITVAWIRKKS